ncbi:MAG: ArsR/SmtB family transcription factor [bacterium]
MKKTAVDFKQQARLLRAIANETRLKIIDVLSNGQMHVGAIAHRIGAEQSTVSKHLAILRAVGIVDDERHGNEVYYRLRTSCITGFFSCALDVIKEREI